MNLGNQFGLSLYNDGSTADVIGKTLDTEKPKMDGEYALDKIAAVNSAISETALKVIWDQIETDGFLDAEFDDGSGDTLRAMIVDHLKILREQA
jgi:hypothetical protein